MGCDIHMRAEVLKGKKWELVGKVFKNPYYYPTNSDNEWNAEFTAEPYGGRNYDLFAVLADVRNGRGFAGIKTGEGFNIIAEPKGIPEDCSSEAEKFLNSYGVDGHSHSYFTIKELLDFDWHQLTMKRGILTLSEYGRIKSSGEKPTSYCGDISGRLIVKISETVADAMLIETPIAELDLDYRVIYHWGDTYESRCSDFVKNTIPELLKLGEPEKVRIVFFFDN